MVLLFVAVSTYALVFPLRKRAVAFGTWFDQNPKKGFLLGYLVAACVALTLPPCFLVLAVGRDPSIRHVSTTYMPVWDRGQYRIDYGVLLIEELALACLAGAGLLVHNAVRVGAPTRRQ
jgi:hypothetical protein